MRGPSTQGVGLWSDVKGYRDTHTHMYKSIYIYICVCIGLRD